MAALVGPKNGASGIRAIRWAMRVWAHCEGGKRIGWAGPAVGGREESESGIEAVVIVGPWMRSDGEVLGGSGSCWEGDGMLMETPACE